MSELATWLSTWLTYTVYDKTGMVDRFDIQIAVPGPRIAAPGKRLTLNTQMIGTL
jgi:hypothetical protein